jgi:hypothetical protein
VGHRAATLDPAGGRCAGRAARRRSRTHDPDLCARRVAGHCRSRPA